jgi:hypothetical protein
VSRPSEDALAKVLGDSNLLAAFAVEVGDPGGRVSDEAKQPIQLGHDHEGFALFGPG